MGFWVCPVKERLDSRSLHDRFKYLKYHVHPLLHHFLILWRQVHQLVGHLRRLRKAVRAAIDGPSTHSCKPILYITDTQLLAVISPPPPSPLRRARHPHHIRSLLGPSRCPGSHTSPWWRNGPRDRARTRKSRLEALESEPATAHHSIRKPVFPPHFTAIWSLCTMRKTASRAHRVRREGVSALPPSRRPLSPGSAMRKRT